MRSDRICTMASERVAFSAMARLCPIVEAISTRLAVGEAVILPIPLLHPY